jgi:hypothetical protein
MGLGMDWLAQSKFDSRQILQSSNLTVLRKQIARPQETSGLGACPQEFLSRETSDRIEFFSRKDSSSKDSTQLLKPLKYLAKDGTHARTRQGNCQVFKRF